MMNRPYLTNDLPGVGGSIKQCPEDFRVDEIPLYEASGRGTHVYFKVIKTGIPTLEAIGRLARHMGVRPVDLGFAGMKDARAVTTQWMSLEHADSDRLQAYRDKQVQVVSVGKHTNKLRAGHLAGNRFAIRIRGVGADQLDAASAILDVLIRRGVPNYFGPQRFGMRGDTDLLGEALVKGDLDEFVSLLLGRPAENDPPEHRSARQAFEEGDYEAALKHWPGNCRDQRSAVAAYARKKRPEAALAAVDKRMRRLYVSALQSAVFNNVLAERIQTVDCVQVGDMAQKIDSGGVFLVEDAAIEQPRADAFEISPTGPVPGYRCKLAQGRPGRIEAVALAGRGLSLEDFRKMGSLKSRGARRALRFCLTDAGISAGSDDAGEFLELAFAAPSGCYATVVVEELTKVRT